MTVLLSISGVTGGFISSAATAAKTPAAKSTDGKSSLKAPAVKAPVIPQIQSDCAAVLVQLEIMAKPAKTGPKLSDKIKLEDFTALLNNAMSIVTEEAADKKATVKSSKTSKAKVNYITSLNALKAILKALGYGDSLEGAEQEKIMEEAASLGLTDDLKLSADKQITRGEAAVLIYNSLTVDFH